MKKYFLFLAISIFSLSCRDIEKTQSAPENLLTKEQMINIMTELHMAEAKTSTARLPSDSAHMLFLHLQERVMLKYNTDTAQYNSSYKWYAENVKQMDEIYSAVVDSLEARKNTKRIE